jgi:hypothetical protein
MADAEEEGRIVVGKLDELGFGVGEERLQLLQGFARDEGFLFRADAGESLAVFSMWARRWPSVATMAMDSALRISSAPLSV